MEKHIDGIDVLFNQVLIAVYERPKVTASGIHLPDQSTDEDRYQGKVGLVLKRGQTHSRKTVTPAACSTART